MTVAQKLAAVGKIIDELRATPCESCGHPYGKHQWQQQCTAFTEFVNMKGVVCKCKKYIDPEETLPTDPSKPAVRPRVEKESNERVSE